MPTFNVLAGDLAPGIWSLETNWGTPIAFSRGMWDRVTIPIEHVASLNAVDDETRGGGFSVGRAIVGGVLLGGVGAIVGGMTKKTRRDVTFTCTLRDGRSFLARVNGQDWPHFLKVGFCAQRADTVGAAIPTATEIQDPPTPEWVERAMSAVSAQTLLNRAPTSSGSVSFGKRKKKPGER